METYEFEVTLKVRVEAYEQSDAEDAVSDVFATGDELGLTVTDVSIVKV